MTEEFNDPYDPAGQSVAGETPLLDRVIQDAIDTALLELHTAMPGKVMQINGNTKADIQPLLQRRYKDGTLQTLPIIQGVPICFPSGKDWWVKCPVAVGDTGMIVFAERSIDKWLVAGGFSDPADTRKHDISDAMFYPGLKPFSETIPGDPQDMVLHNGKAEVQMKKAGKFKITNGDQELLDLISQTEQALVDATVNTIFGLSKLNNFSVFAQLKGFIDSLKG